MTESSRHVYEVEDHQAIAVDRQPGSAGGQHIAETWARTHAVTLAPKTANHYASLYDLHLSPFLGDLKLVELTPEVVARWQAERGRGGRRRRGRAPGARSPREHPAAGLN